MNQFGAIFLYNNDHIQKIIINKNNNSTIRMITINTLKKEIEFFKPKDYNYFIQKGLNKNLKPENIIAITLKNRFNNDILKYYSFNNSHNEFKNDIPFYHPNAPEGYSLFCSKFEFDQLTEYLKKNINIKKKKSYEENSIDNEPIPSKKHFICQICKIQFDNYMGHICSKLHDENKLKYKNIFNKVKLTFRRIVNLNEENKNIKNNKVISISDNNREILELNISEENFEKINSFSNYDNINNNITTLFDSCLINEENKDYYKKKEKQNLDSFINKNNESCTEKKSNIFEKSILSPLENIDDNSKNYPKNIRKRKKDDKNKYYINYFSYGNNNENKFNMSNKNYLFSLH